MREPAVPVKEMDRQALLKPHAIQSSDCREKADRRVVATHENVLAVVHHGAGCKIKEGARPPTQIGLLFEQAHTAATFRQCDTCRQARKTAADNEDVFQGFRIQDSGFSNQNPILSEFEPRGVVRVGPVRPLMT